MILEALLATSTKLSVVSLSTAETKATVSSVVFTTKSLSWTVSVNFWAESTSLFVVVAVSVRALRPK